MLALRLPPKIEKRLGDLPKKTGRTKSFYAREAILRHIEDIEDYHLARRRLSRRGRRLSLSSASAEDDPFAAFSEWTSEADEGAYGAL